MNLHKFAQELQEQCEEISYLRSENAKLKERLAKYENHISDELEFWQNTYGNILIELVENK